MAALLLHRAIVLDLAFQPVAPLDRCPDSRARLLHHALGRDDLVVQRTDFWFQRFQPGIAAGHRDVPILQSQQRFKIRVHPSSLRTE
ncbi:MAG: hypothetical protein DMD58_03125 [Gemmatimonadetes bacterium]|nr:MAG: hypothetical protein DMD58_03125 [Gemmatimonadota bacterium]